MTDNIPIKKAEPKTRSAMPVMSDAGILRQILAGNPSRTSDLTNKKNAQRVLVITSVAKIDDDLLRLLQLYMVSPSDNEDLIKEGAPLGSLKLRAKLCFRLGLVSLELFQLIKMLAEVRNDCSHKPDELNVFDEESVRARIDNHWTRLNPELFDSKTRETEERFKLICSFISIYLGIQINSMSGGMQHKIEILFRGN